MIEWWQNGMIGCIVEYNFELSHEMEYLVVSENGKSESLMKQNACKCQAFHSMRPPNIPFYDISQHFIKFELLTLHSMTQANIPFQHFSRWHAPNIPLHETSESSILWHFPTFNSMTPPSIPFNNTSTFCSTKINKTSFYDTCKHSVPAF